MAMEAHSLRFVRCPKCHQLLVEYPSIPVYKCGGCGMVLRAKHRAVPVAQAGSESEEHNDFPCSLKNGSPQNSESVCSGEQKAVSSVDQPSEATAPVSISYTANDINSCDSAIQERAMSAANSVSDSKHLNEETSLTIDGEIRNSGVMVKEEEIHEKDNGSDSSSNLTGKVENVDASENGNGGGVDNVGTSEMGKILHGKDEAVHREERLYTYKGMHVESHKALIEELERSLSFSSDDGYFSDEAENSGLSDALRYQMGSRRFMLGGKMNAPRSDPHGRLIEELEMSFSDVEEPLEQHAVVADVNVPDKDPHILGAESAHHYVESLSSFDNGHLYSEQKRLISNGDEVNECIEDENNNAKHTATANEKTAERFHEKEHGKDWQCGDMESAYPCEASTSSVDDGSIKVKQSFQQNDLTAGATQAMEEICMEDDSITNHVHGNDNLVLADGGVAERVHENEQLAADGTQEMEESCMEDDNMTNCINGNDNLVLASENIAERVHVNKKLTAGGPKEMEDDNMANCVHSNDNLVLVGENIAEGVHGNEEIRAGGPQEMEDDNMTNCVHSNDNLVLADEHIAERVHGNKGTGDSTVENEEICMENENETAAIADQDISKKVHENERCTDQQSLEAEGAHLCEGVISLHRSRHVKSEQNLEQDEPTADVTKGKEEDDMEDGNLTSHVQENNAAVARLSSLPNKTTQCKLASFNKNKEQVTYRYRGNQLRQGHSLDSDYFNSIQNFMESQMDGTSSSVSSGSPSQGDLVPRTSNNFNNIVRHERLKKMDELRDQLSRLSSQKVSERSFQNRGPEYQQLSNSYDVEQNLQSVDGDSIPSSGALESYYGYARPPRYQPPNPFSPTHTYAYLHFGHAQTRLPQNYDPWEFNSYYQPSYAESTIIDHESLMSSYKEQRRVVRKQILRPLSGASPFTICSSCFNLVQMPSDIYISKSKVGKMQCGKCSKVMALSFPTVHNADGKINEGVAQDSCNRDDGIVAKNKDIASYYAECLTGGPVSMSEYYGASNSCTRSLPTQAGPSSLAATHRGKKVSDSALHRLMGYESASQLLRHSRVFEDGY